MLDLTLSISDCNHSICRADSWGGEDIWFETAMIYFVVTGRGWLKVGGKKIALLPGRLYLIPPHSTRSHGTSSKAVIDWVHFLPNSSSLRRMLVSLGEVYRFNKIAARRWGSMGRLMARFARHATSSDICRVHAMILELVGIALSKIPEESPKTRDTYERLAPAIDLLDASALGPIHLPDIARSVFLSSKHFERLFREVFHTTPSRYVHSRRMDAAKRSLCTTGQTVSQIAEAVGYSDPFYFSRVFREHFGSSPLQYRQSGRPVF